MCRSSHARSRLWLALFVGGGLTLGACSAPATDAVEGDADRRQQVQDILREPLPADPGPDVGGLSLQENLLEDGRLMFADYERAVRSTVDCIRERGFSVDGPSRFPDAPFVVVEPGGDPTRTLVWTYGNVVDEEALDEVTEACRAQWSYWVERAWELQHLPSEQEVQAWLDRAWECARERGIALSDPPSEADATQAVVAGCRPWEGSD